MEIKKKLENVWPKVSKQGKAKRDGVINPQNYNICMNFKPGKFDLSKR